MLRECRLKNGDMYVIALNFRNKKVLLISHIFFYLQVEL